MATVMVGTMIAIGGHDGGQTDVRLVRYVGGSVLGQAEEEAVHIPIPVLRTDDPTPQQARLVIPIAADGIATPEPAVSAASVAPVVSIPEPEIRIARPVVPTDWNGIEQWRPLVASIFPDFAVDAAMSVMWCESRGDPNAIGAAGERGLFQIMPYWHQPKADALFGSGANLYDPHINTVVAFVISDGGNNWNAWTCQP